MIRRSIVYICLMSTLACAGHDKGGVSPRRIAIAEGQVQVDSFPSLDISAPAGGGAPYLLLPVGAVRLSDGVIVVADYAAPDILFFDSAGHLVRKIGRAGGNPGEFKIVSWLGRCGGDSVFAWDQAQNRITVINSLGKIIRTYRPSGTPSMMACSVHGVFALFMSPPGLKNPDPVTGQSLDYRSALWFADAQGDTTRLLGQLPIGENRPLGRFTRIALSDNRLYVGTADSAFVDAYGLNGQFLASLPVGTPPRAPSERNYERAIDRLVSRFPRRRDRESMKRKMLAIPMPARLPSYTDLLTDPDDRLWVVTSAAGDPATELRALSVDGQRAADVLLPFDMKVFEIGQDYILGAYEDQGGVPHIVMYRIRWSVSPRAD